MFVSVAVFTLTEVAIGAVLGPLVLGRFVTPMLRLRVEMVLHLASYFAGGFVVGVLTPGVRLAEPAVGAMLSVVLSFLMSFFLPHSFFHFSIDKILVSGTLACLLAAFGAFCAERALGNVK